MELAEAYRCLTPPAYRADLFRFCALSAQGGVYVDGDLLLLVPLDQTYSPCSAMSVGHDYPQARLPRAPLPLLHAAAPPTRLPHSSSPRPPPPPRPLSPPIRPDEPAAARRGRCAGQAIR